MMRALAIVLLLVTSLWGASSTTYVVAGLGGTGPATPDVAVAWLAAQVPQCCRFVPPVGITATRLAFLQNAAMSAGGKCGAAIYPDSDSGTALATTGGLACDAANLVKTVTGLPSFTLVAGTTYRACGCATTNSNGYYSTSFSTSVGGILNAFTPAILTANVGTSANLCGAATGAPPASTGQLTGSTSARCPLILISAEP